MCFKIIIIKPITIYNYSMLIKNIFEKEKVEEMTQKLRILATFPEDPSSQQQLGI